MKVLIACEESQTVCKAFRERGHEAIDAAPTVDAVAVIRCKDCIHYIAGYCCRDVGSRTNMVKYEPDDFCSYAVRRE